MLAAPAAAAVRTVLAVAADAGWPRPVRVWEPGGVTVAALVLAHQGGWDEMLMVLVPIAIFAGLLVMANRRASRIEEQRVAADGPPGDGAPGGDQHQDGPATP